MVRENPFSYNYNDVVLMNHTLNQAYSTCDCVYRETLDHRDPLVKTVPLAFEASLEREVYLVPR